MSWCILFGHEFAPFKGDNIYGKSVSALVCKKCGKVEPKETEADPRFSLGKRG